MKQTLQKQIILETVRNMIQHPTADEVYKEICKHGHEVGIATVYRNLNAFVRKGLIHKVTIANAADRFDYRLDHHEHFFCQQCHKVYDANVMVEITPIGEAIDYQQYSLTLFGVCTHCKKQKQTMTQLI